MPRFTLSLLFVFAAISLSSQNISVTFSGTGAATRVDHVTATNLQTDKSVTVPGNETLVLTANTGIPVIADLSNMGVVFPNPFPGKASFIFNAQEAQPVALRVQNLFGQVVAQINSSVGPGENEFSFSVSTPGIYVVSLANDHETASYKVLSTEAGTAGNSIIYHGTLYENPGKPGVSIQSALKSIQTSYTLGYTSGDVILYKCTSGNYTTIITDSPVASRNYPVDFVACSDQSGKNYPIVKIGNQTWMAENLAWLSTAYPSSVGSDASPYNYVYDYDGNSMTDAKATANFATYGVLYNWVAANAACPTGWHLPSDAEWTSLTDYLGNSAGGKLKESGTQHWTGPNEGAANSSGYTALPGGALHGNDGFIDLGMQNYFWSSTEDGAANAWYRSMEKGSATVTRSSDSRSSGFSVRCLLGAVMPTITTTALSGISGTSANGGGKVTSSGGAIITSRGICWNTTGSPTLSDSKSIDGAGTGTFTSILAGLNANTIYHVRAYATNSIGTAYGNELAFTAVTIVQNDIQILDNKITAFMNTYHIPGASLAVSKNGKLVYMKGYGFADQSNNEMVTPAHRFRLASISKTYTAIGIMKLIQDGQLNLDQKVFGSGSILGSDFGTAPYKANLKAITIRHLLQHLTGAWGSATGGDVIDYNPDYTDKQMMDWIIDTRPMQYLPGTYFDYSNMNYFILGRIIEKVSGQTYFDFIKTFLNTIGASVTEIAGKTLAERKPLEVKYYGPGQDDQYVYNIAFPRRTADGGLISTARDLLKLVTAIDGFDTRPDILNRSILNQFAAPSTVYQYYACGIGIWAAQNLWFNDGSLPGTRTWFMRHDNGMCVSLLFNSRPALDPNNVFTYAMQDLCLDIVNNTIYHWQNIDQF